MTPPQAVEARELLACPFCGGDAQPALVQGGGMEWAQVECVDPKCGAVGPTPATEAEAIAAWNTRPALSTTSDPGAGDVAGEADWLVLQLEAWPTRVDPEKTTNIGYLMKEAAKRLTHHHAPVREETLREAAAECVKVMAATKGITGDLKAGAQQCRNAILARIGSPIVAVPSVPREPTEAMVDAGGKQTTFTFPSTVLKQIWRAMYDAALSPDPASDGEGEVK